MSMFNWQEINPAGPTDFKWYPTACDNDFNHLLAGIFCGGLYQSNDGGASWSLASAGGHLDRNWVAIALSNDGQYRLANAEYNGARAYRSSDYGVTWSEVVGGVDRMWYSASMDGTGQHQLMGVNGGRLYVSNNYGVTWTDRRPYGPATDAAWLCADVCKGNGQIMLAGVGRDATSGKMFRSTNGGITWYPLRPRGEDYGLYYDAAQNADGTKIVIVEEGFQKVWLSNDSGVTWADITPHPPEWPGEFRSVSMSADGTKIIVAANAGRMYYTDNQGGSWTEERPHGLDMNRAWSVSAANWDLSKIIICDEGPTTSSSDLGKLYLGTIAGGPAAPIADFTAAPETGDAPLTVGFTDTSVETTSWLWDFGDGLGSVDRHPIHEYTVPGTYTVVLTATGDGGSHQKIGTDYVTVNDPISPIMPGNDLPDMKVGNTQAEAGARAGERWRKPDGSLWVGL